MSTIPADEVVDVIPSTLTAGGGNFELNGLVLSTSSRVPIGTVQSFPYGGAASPAAQVAAYFGPTSNEAIEAGVYFQGYEGATAIPGEILFAQFPVTAVPAWLRGGNVSSMPLTTLQGLNGPLSIVVDGFTRAATINLSAATSFSAAAAIIQADLNASLPTAASISASIAPGSASFTAQIAGNVMTVSAVTSGTIEVGGTVTGSGVAAGTVVTGIISGSGGVGTYAVNNTQAVPSTAMTETYGVMTVTSVSSGTISVGDTVTGSGVAVGTVVTALGTGTGLAGTYFLNNSQTVAAETLTLTATAITVVYDSVSGAFIITSGVVGTPSTIAFATGSIATSLLLTQALGAVTSPGAYPQAPAAFMAGIVAVTQNWATFFLAFDPDGGLGNAQKLAFCAWVSTTSDSYAFICWDLDQSPTTTVPASASLGALIAAAGYSGVFLVSETSNQHIAAFVSGTAAAINFNAVNGRITFKFRSQPGLVASVTSAAVASNLEANGYNFYGVYGSGASTWIFLAPGTVSGPFDWMDSYVNQIWLNNALQTALMNFLTTVGSVPYNAAGFSQIEQALASTIEQGLSFGAYRAGVTLSSTQILEVNEAAGANIAPTLQSQGWYLQVSDPGPAVRAVRGSPVCFFWYVDGESVQMITLGSVDVQ